MGDEGKVKYTVIKIRVDTRERMRKLKLTRRESYDEIINRVLDRLESKEKK